MARFGLRVSLMAVPLEYFISLASLLCIIILFGMPVVAQVPTPWPGAPIVADSNSHSSQSASAVFVDTSKIVRCDINLRQSSGSKFGDSTPAEYRRKQ